MLAQFDKFLVAQLAVFVGVELFEIRLAALFHFLLTVGLHCLPLFGADLAILVGIKLLEHHLALLFRRFFALGLHCLAFFGRQLAVLVLVEFLQQVRWRPLRAPARWLALTPRFFSGTLRASHQHGA